MVPIIYFNGEYFAKDELHISPDDRGFLFGDGVYDVTPCYRSRFLGLPQHLARLRRGLVELGINGLEVETLAQVSRELIRRNGLEGEKAMVYKQVTRGVAPRTHAFPNPPVQPTVYAYATRIVQKCDAERGAGAITVTDVRWARCDIKAISLLANCLANQKAMEAGVYEAIFVRDGIALEGSHSGLFAVLGGIIYTAPKSTHVLPSITRDIVLDICHEEDIPAREEAVPLQRLRRADEAFLVGTTTEVLPLVQLDGQPIGTGTPGAVTRRIVRLFAERAANGVALRESPGSA